MYAVRTDRRSKSYVRNSQQWYFRSPNNKLYIHLKPNYVYYSAHHFVILRNYNSKVGNILGEQETLVFNKYFLSPEIIFYIANITIIKVTIIF